MAERVKLGNRGSRLNGVKLTALQVLVRADRPLRLIEVFERGWPEIQRDDYGLLLHDVPGYEWKMAARRHRIRVERDVGVALRDLRKKGLAESERPDGWAANVWLITPVGIDWMNAEGADFRASVQADLDALPTTEERP